MKKFKIVAAYFGCVLALAALFVPAFALDPDYDPDVSFTTDIVLDPVRLPGDFLPLADPAVTTSSDNVINRVFSGNKAGFTFSFISDSPLVYGSASYSALRGFLADCGFSSRDGGFARGVSLAYADVSGPVYVNATYICVSGGGSLSSISRLEISFPDDSYLEAAQALDPSLYRVTQNQGIGHALGTQIWSFGDNLISFVKSHFIVMIPLVLWLLVVAISAIKKIAVPEG